MMYILDTNVVSELRKAKTNKIDPQVMKWAESVSAEQLYLSSITLLELEAGVLGLERKDEAQGEILRQWLEEHVIPAFSGRILAFDESTARQCAKLHVPNRRSDRDAMIAATALVHGMTVVTRNIKDFQSMGVSLINPWVFSI